ncbi:DEKNAAC103214 [Brettanomyces naardenensis]|uniref:DEKNAAC103214 n=1 Tax=Brettanomyces naardenensis TaxID=13370 RepID=A0A448YMU0_BRENA|nr:DEKNAAC103214 [Brettanomyces naardenensis]
MELSNWWHFLGATVGHSRPSTPKFIDKDYPDLTGKVFLVSGGTSGVGFEVVKKLLGKNAKVWILGRSRAKLDALIADLKKTFPRSQLNCVVVDLSDLSTIKLGIQPLLNAETRLHGIIHNAGVMNPPGGSKTKQGYELQLGTNDIGPFLLQKFLDHIIIATAKQEPANEVRIIWVSSAGHFLSPSGGGIEWNDINFEHTKKSWTSIYGQSKAVDIYLSYMWAKKHPDSGVLSISCHPGLLRTELTRYHPVGRISSAGLKIISPMYPAYFGAYTELFAALSPSLKTANSGSYVIPWGQMGSARQDVKLGMTGENGERIWDWIDKQVTDYE